MGEKLESVSFFNKTETFRKQDHNKRQVRYRHPMREQTKPHIEKEKNKKERKGE